MAGLYLHIPFCKKACHYCNFHFSTSLSRKSDMVQAIIQEIRWQKEYLKGATLDSIYFGGGTPSLLSITELQAIFELIYQLHPVSDQAEITLEANPDDLSLAILQDLKQHTPINRLSIGIQSFSEDDLVFMNRAHNAKEARNCIDWAKQVGFHNLTIDLIYGTPTMSDKQWATNLEIAFQYDIPHLSAYCLTVEPKTALAHFVKNGKVTDVNEQQAALQFEYLIQATQQATYEHYEISNFAKSGWRAKHNSNYWLGEPYLGVGPSAHSFDGQSRQWNIANNAQYLKAIAQQKIPFEQEFLMPEQRYNEYIMTALRTAWGCDGNKITVMYPKFETHFKTEIQPFLQSGHIQQSEGIYTLTTAGKLLADNITMSLFVEEET